VIGPLRKTLILGKPVRYRVRRSLRIKRVTVEITPREGMVIVLPKRAAAGMVDEALTQMSGWIDTNVDKYGVREGPLRSELTTGSALLLRGERVVVQLAALPEGRKRARISVTGDLLLCELPPQDILDPRPTLERWLRREARGDILPRVEHWAQKLDLHPSRVIVGERKTRWGSCTGRGTLSFCYRLVMARPRDLDAVVAHEICHLAHHGHGKRFWALLDRACPWHKETTAWLTDHQEAMAL